MHTPLTPRALLHQNGSGGEGPRGLPRDSAHKPRVVPISVLPPGPLLRGRHRRKERLGLKERLRLKRLLLLLLIRLVLVLKRLLLWLWLILLGWVRHPRVHGVGTTTRGIHDCAQKEGGGEGKGGNE